MLGQPPSTLKAESVSISFDSVGSKAEPSSIIATRILWFFSIVFRLNVFIWDNSMKFVFNSRFTDYFGMAKKHK